MAIVSGHASTFRQDQRAVNGRLERLLDSGGGPVHAAMRYATLGPGQRLRPLLTLRIARLLDQPTDSITQAAASVELMHCASLIVDDLPCMDNDRMRRNRPTVHVEFGESTALLAAFGLVALAARSVAGRPAFQIALLETLGASGLLEGQALDLQLTGASREHNRDRVIAMKTTPLFELAVHAGMLDAPISASARDRLLSFGREFGAAYQTLDDLLDGELAGGPAVVKRQLGRARACLSGFGERASDLHEMLDYLDDKLPLNAAHQ